MPGWGLDALALLAAAALGVALQRGTTCLVAALDELVLARSAARLLALGEAVLWVTGGLVLLDLAGHRPVLPGPPRMGGWGLLGAGLLGAGALLNGACVLGTIARIGNGDWAFLAMGPGFLGGCWVAHRWATWPDGPPVATGAWLVPVASPWWAAALLGVALLRVGAGMAWQARRQGRLTAGSPHVATTLVGLMYLGLLTLAGAWTYTDHLVELARPQADVRLDASWKAGGLTVAMLVGAMLGGWRARRGVRRPVGWVPLGRCAAGGALMGSGAVLLPGGNDSLILLSLPQLWPQAGLALLVMGAVVACGLWGMHGIRRP